MKGTWVFLALFPLTVLSQDYPVRPLRMLVGFPPGGAMDAIARTLAPRLGDGLGQPVVVENRPGAGGGIAADALVRSAADGYVILLAESGTLIVPGLSAKAAYDPVRQFAPVGGVCSLPLAFVVTPSFPSSNIQEFIGILKSNPGKYSYASPGVGTLQHLAFELFKRQAGVDAVHVPYKGAGAMMPDLMSGQVPIGVISATVAVAQARTGKIRALAVTSPQRLPGAAEIPALAETLPGFDASPNVFVVAPAGTPPAVMQRLANQLSKSLVSPEVLEAFAKFGATATPIASEELGRRIAAETSRWASVVKEAGIKAE